MSSNAFALSTGAACEPPKLIVQVVGKDHPQTQRLAIYDETNMQELQGLTAECKLEKQNGERFSSELHVWNWIDQPKRNLWLKIESEQGDPIRVPLFEGLKPTSRELPGEAQWNQIVPVVPMTALPGSTSRDDHGTPVSLRSGFIYVFYRERLWRELEVRTQVEKTTYHDIDVARYRNGRGFRLGTRDATGKALDDIWLPAHWCRTQKSAVQICFSEVQLSAARLSLLEQDKSLRGQRCQTPTLSASDKDWMQRFSGQPYGKEILDAYSTFNAQDTTSLSGKARIDARRSNLRSFAYPIDIAAPQRSREPGYEWLLDHPGRYICDLSGQFPLESLRAAQTYLANCEKAVVQREPLLLEADAWRYCLEKLTLEKQPAEHASQCTAENTANAQRALLWEAQPAVADLLADARRRQLCAILLDDHMYRMRHLHGRISDLQNTLILCANRAALHPHHGSALLLQQLVVPRSLNGQRNPLNDAMAKIDTHGRSQINLYSAVSERSTLWQRLVVAQDSLAEHMGQGDFQQTLADHMSLDGFNYLAACCGTSNLLAAIATHPAQIDPLSANSDLTDAVTGVSLCTTAATKGQKLLAKLNDDPRHPLRRMLWPELDQESLYSPYQKPAKEENRGDGRFRATALAEFENKDTPAPQSGDTLDSALLISLMAAGSMNSSLTAQLKAGAGAIVSFCERIQTTIDTALAAVAAERKNVEAQRRTAQGAEQNHARAHQEQMQRRAAIAAEGRVVRLRLYSNNLNMMRSTLPTLFSEAVFIRSGRVNIKEHYIFGLEDLPAPPAMKSVAFNGQFYDGNGVLLATSNTKQARKAGFDQLGEALMIAVPKTSRIAGLVSELNQDIQRTQQAAAQVQTARSNLAQAESALQRAVDNVAAQGRSAAYRLFNSRPFAALILLLEIWNVVEVEWASFEQTSAEKSGLRASMGTLGAIVDLSIAAEALAVKIAGDQSSWALARKKAVLTISDKAANRLGPALGAKLNREFSARLIGQSLAALIFTGLSTYDFLYAMQWNDDAMWGYLLMAGGGLAGLVAGLFTAAPVLGLTPLGWVSLILIAAGAGLTYWLSSTPLQDWMANGPFSTATSVASSHLRDPQEAFYRLLGLFAGIRIEVLANPGYQVHAMPDASEDLPYAVRASNTLIRISSNLPGLASRVGGTAIRTESRLRSSLNTFDMGVSVTSSTLGPATKPAAQRTISNVLELYFDTPLTESRNYLLSSDIVINAWQSKVQFHLTDSNGRIWYFPAPLPKAQVSISEAFKAPNFNQNDQPFWANS